MTNTQKITHRENMTNIVKLINDSKEAKALLDAGEYGQLSVWLSARPEGMVGRSKAWCAVGLARSLQSFLGNKAVVNVNKRALRIHGELPTAQLDRKVAKLVRVHAALADVADALNAEKIPYINSHRQSVRWDAKIVSNYKQAMKVRSEKPAVPASEKKRAQKSVTNVRTRSSGTSFNVSTVDTDGSKTTCGYVQKGDHIDVALTYNGSVNGDAALGLKALLEQLKLYPMKS